MCGKTAPTGNLKDSIQKHILNALGAAQDHKVDNPKDPGPLDRIISLIKQYGPLVAQAAPYLMEAVETVAPYALALL
jgi:hypothetical protein